MDVAEQKLPRPTVSPLPDPTPITTVPFKWEHVNIGGKEYLAVDGKGYEVLSRNMAEFLRWIREARDRLDWYTKELTRERGESGISAVAPKP